MGELGLTLLGPTSSLPTVRAARDLDHVRAVLSFKKGMGGGGHEDAHPFASLY